MIAKLSDSVAPEVQIISLGSQLIKLATFTRASSTNSSAFQPKTCDLDPELPKAPSTDKHSFILSTTNESTGVVEA